MAYFTSNSSFPRASIIPIGGLSSGIFSSSAILSEGYVDVLNRLLNESSDDAVKLFAFSGQIYGARLKNYRQPLRFLFICLLHDIVY